MRDKFLKKGEVAESAPKGFEEPLKPAVNHRSILEK